MITCKRGRELDAMRVSGRLAGEVLRQVAAAVVPGITTRELDALARQLIDERGGTPSFLGYRGFPAALCVSVNEEVIHGIPGARRILPGDVVGLDVGVLYQGFHGDTATTVLVGVSDPDILRLVDATRRARDAGIAAIRPGVKLGDVSHAVEQVVRLAGCTVVRDFVGHGIGRQLHEDPQIPNYGSPGRGPVLKVGMTLCIEPMVNLGRPDVSVLRDGWTVVTQDGRPSAHFEHTVAVSASGAEILTAV
ncbi:MAG: type I methionyl aminopeptidase [Lentisphaerae bacterium]|nr:type I methionyl aminopeptidase [Lentisphaerota bacterium]